MNSFFLSLMARDAFDLPSSGPLGVLGRVLVFPEDGDQVLGGIFLLYSMMSFLSSEENFFLGVLAPFLMNLPLLKFFLGQVDPGNLWCRHLVFAGEFPVPVREQGMVGCHMSRKKGLFPLCVDVWLIFVHPYIWVSVERSKNLEDVLKPLKYHPFLHEAHMLHRNVNYLAEMFKTSSTLISSSCILIGVSGLTSALFV